MRSSPDAVLGRLSAAGNARGECAARRISRRSTPRSASCCCAAARVTAGAGDAVRRGHGLLREQAEMASLVFALLTTVLRDYPRRKAAASTRPPPPSRRAAGAPRCCCRSRRRTRTWTCCCAIWNVRNRDLRPAGDGISRIHDEYGRDVRRPGPPLSTFFSRSWQPGPNAGKRKHSVKGFKNPFESPAALRYM